MAVNKVKHRLTQRLRVRLNTALHRNSKTGEWRQYLGCSIGEFKIYLESRFKVGMSWDNYGKKWQIDHIMPCAIFDLSKYEHRKRCFHFSNMRPLWAAENRRKQAKVVTDQYGLL
jgi:hypothetical protein